MKKAQQPNRWDKHEDSRNVNKKEEKNLIKFGEWVDVHFSTLYKPH